MSGFIEVVKLVDDHFMKCNLIRKAWLFLTFFIPVEAVKALWLYKW